MRTSDYKPLALAVLLGAGLCGAAWAAQPITITNAGFEDPVLDDGILSSGAPGWTAFNGASIAVLNPAASDLAAGAPEGENVGLVTSTTSEDGLAQTLTSTFQADASYELTVKVANTKVTTGFPGYRVQLVANNTVLAEQDNTQAVAEDAVVTAMATYTYNAGDAGLLGQPLAIRLLSKGLAGGQEVAFDDVRLTVSLANPAANPGGPYTVSVIGSSLALIGSASLPSDGETIVSYEWDLNNDGTFGDITGETPAAISAEDLQTTWNMSPGPNTIQLRVTDSAAKTASASTTVTLTNDLYWDGGSEDLLTDGDGASQGGAGTWNTALLNWDAGAAMPHVAWSNSSNSTAVFGGAAGVVSLATDIAVGGLTFNTNGYTLSGQTLTFGTAGTILNNVGATISSVLAGALPITKSGTGQLTLNGVNQHTAGTIINGGTVAFDKLSDAAFGIGGDITASADAVLLYSSAPANSTNVTFNRGFVLNNGAVARLRYSGTTTITGPVTGTGGLWFSNTNAASNTLNLTSLNNTFTGPIVLNNENRRSGILVLNSMADGPGPITFANGALAANTFRWSAAAVTPLVLNSRQFVFPVGPSATDATTNIIENANPDPANTITVNTDIVVTAALARTLTLSGVNAGNNTFAGIISNGTASMFSLTKAGTGRWIVSGDNEYTGATTVSAGTLLINGDQSAATGAVAVTGTSTLGGSGTIGGDVSVTADANLAPGASVGTLSIGGNLTISAMAGGAGKLVYELGPLAASDRIAVTGTLNLGDGMLGFGDFDFTNVGGLQENETYILITSGTLNGSLDAGDLTGKINGFDTELQISGQNIVLIVNEASVPTGYALWAATNAPTGNPGDDYDGDGVGNAVEFVLGGDKDTNDLGKLPGVMTTPGGDMVFSFIRDQTSIGASVAVTIEVGTDLVTWNTAPSPYAVPDTATAGPPVAVVDNGDGTDTVTLTVTRAPDAKKFARLKVAIVTP